MLETIVESNLVPDFLIRKTIHKFCKERLDQQLSLVGKSGYDEKRSFVRSLSESPIAIVPEKANEQHYEVPASFYDLCLGKRKKYSSCYYDESVRSLDEAEERMLALYFERAEFKDGQSILELGCGWGSLTLYLAERLPNSSITGVSNSRSQKEYILSEANKRGLSNVSIITCDMNEFSIEKKFDRIISIEMFEHMRNWDKLFQRVSSWLNDEGKFFMHIFTHRTFAYPYEDKGASDWMSRYFFSGGMMPSDDLPLYFQDHLSIDDHWMLSGTHYEKTARDWLDKLDTNQKKAIDLFEQTYGKGQGTKWYVRWRLFFMACEELFGFDDGKEWGVSHYRFTKRRVN
jgi:cyclopropane-fatty-acyl-phospholipid synthase